MTNLVVSLSKKSNKYVVRRSYKRLNKTRKKKNKRNKRKTLKMKGGYFKGMLCDIPLISSILKMFGFCGETSPNKPGLDDKNYGQYNYENVS